MNRKQLRIFRRKLEDILYPPRCIICDELLETNEQGIHKSCIHLLYPVNEPTCMHCGRPFALPQREYCYDCERKHRKHTRQGKSLYLYQEAAKMMMYRFKYSNKREYAYFFAQDTVRRYDKWIRQSRIQAIVPVPMYRKKERMRGYNQARTFAKELSLLTGIPIWEAVHRIRDTAPQKGLDDIGRKNNLKNAFQFCENNVKYKYILLVDDIYTTGSTIDSVARVLRLAGVEEVFFLSICIGKGF